MSDTQTLEEDYWYDRRQAGPEEASGDQITRFFRVPRIAFDSLAPTPGTDTAYDDSDYVVTRVDRGRIYSPVMRDMIVTYLKRTAGTSPA